MSTRFRWVEIGACVGSATVITGGTCPAWKRHCPGSCVNNERLALWRRTNIEVNVVSSRVGVQRNRRVGDRNSVVRVCGKPGRIHIVILIPTAKPVFEKLSVKAIVEIVGFVVLPNVWLFTGCDHRVRSHKREQQEQGGDNRPHRPASLFGSFIH